jgi:Tfp pilus assembly protein PilN
MRAVNLLPREAKTTSKRLPVVVQLALLAPFVVAAVLTAGYLLASAKVNDKKTTLQALQDQLGALPPPPRPQLGPQLAVQRDQRIAALSGALQGRLAWDRVLSEISAVLPGDVWLTALTAQAPQTPTATASPATTSTSSTTTTTTAATPAPAPTGGPMSMTGYTYSQEGVARLLSRLAVIPSLQNVKLLQSALTTVGSRVVVSFSIEAAVRPQVTQ